MHTVRVNSLFAKFEEAQVLLKKRKITFAYLAGRQASADKWSDQAKRSGRLITYEHILKMADALSDGIVKQFPDKFAM